jgi:DNA-binding transcriptional regulator YiaG
MTPVEGTDVKRIRERTAKDQAGFGIALGVSERTIRGWEKGATIPQSMQILLRATEAALIGGEALKHWGRQIARELRPS